MKLELSRFGIVLAWAWLLACSGDGTRRGLRVGATVPDGGAAGAMSFGNPTSGGSGIGGPSSSDNAIEVEIEHEQLAVELVALRCAGECAEVEAVAARAAAARSR